MMNTNTQLENIIITAFLLHSLNGENIHMDYYYEKCERYLGFAPNPDIMFKDYKSDYVKSRTTGEKLEIKYIFDFKVRHIENIIDEIFNNNLIDKVSKSDNIFEYDDVHGRTTRGNGKYRKILGLHENLTKEILTIIDSAPQGVLRKFNLRKLLCENTI